ncbi:HNH endonuclease [Campylobacter upsaliensis]|uniref:HNH endonuclease n=1 Tax=Campylobacter upsaliensis TaxID=28080 RepID=UPI00127B32C6|nr:HNH endonuclease [Campylobacter upsaliensis]EAH7597868.1 HNH endonuclease [Campylobacter upsaliensis]EAJ2427836.1 HNH endonuclease [Campylobacter upsaliensis]EAJ7018576.1 HNH endonuclease [Campylobacter upsaliensis]EAJ7390408.1 HNH endonuclease [Campylobacter upsaliensis]EAJ7577311.1 HNH endonuclease [Campylobacter upsaliensis]
MKNSGSQLDLIMEFFKAKRDIKHPEVVDWVVKEWQKRTGKVFRDPDGIRSLHQKGYLQKIAKGVYRYEPDFVALRQDLEDFSPALKKQILERDNYKCVICETGKKMFIGMLESAKSSGESELVAFLEEVLSIYEKHNINGHIVWKK